LRRPRSRLLTPASRFVGSVSSILRVRKLRLTGVNTLYIFSQDILISTATVKSLDFTSSFSITATKTGTMHAFLGHFDTFFTPDGSSVAKDAQVDLTRHDESLKVEAKEGDHNEVSFTTGVSSVLHSFLLLLFLLPRRSSS